MNINIHSFLFQFRLIVDKNLLFVRFSLQFDFKVFDMYYYHSKHVFGAFRAIKTIKLSFFIDFNTGWPMGWPLIPW